MSLKHVCQTKILITCTESDISFLNCNGTDKNVKTALKIHVILNSEYGCYEKNVRILQLKCVNPTFSTFS